MIDHVKIFDDIFLRHGHCRLDPQLLDADLLEHQKIQATMTRARAAVHKHRTDRLQFNSSMPEYYFDFIDDPAMNAKADYNETHRCGVVGMFCGTVSLIYDLFYRLLSHPEILPTIGDVSKESLRQPYCSEGIWRDYNDLRDSRGQRGGKLADVIPRDSERREYAERLAEHAIDFLIDHELAHITFGHCQYTHKLSRPFLMEMNASGLTVDEALTSQALEVHADGYASIHTWQCRLRLPTEYERRKRALLERGSHIVVESELLMFDWAFAVYVMFWMFASDIDWNKFATESHPPPQHRSTRAFASVHHFVTHESPTDELVHLEKAWNKAIDAAGDALGHITNEQILIKQADYHALMQSGKMQTHFKNIGDRWLAIQNDVGSYKHSDR